MSIVNLTKMRAASLGLCALATLAFSTLSLAGGNGDWRSTPITPSTSDSNRGSEDSIGTGPYTADLTSDSGAGAGYGVVLPSTEVGSLLLTVSGSGTVQVQDQNDGTTRIQLSGSMSFRLSLDQLSSQSFSVTSPAGSTLGQMLVTGSNVVFMQINSN